MQPEKILGIDKPWMLIDKTIRHIPGKIIVTIKQITASDYFLKGHFPDYSVYPGMLLLEGMFQSAQLLERYADPTKCRRKQSVLANVRFCNVRFLQSVVPGNTVEYTVVREIGTDGWVHFRGTGTTRRETCVRANWKVEGSGR